MNFPSSLLLTSNNIFQMAASSSKVPSVPLIPNSSTQIYYNYNNNNTNLLNQQTVQSSNSLSYFVTPADKNTTISLQDIIDGMKVTQEVSRELATYRLDNNLLQEVMNNLTADLNENPIEWLVQENWKELSKQIDTYEFKETLDENVSLIVYIIIIIIIFFF
jgi:hypothetical protein